MGQNRFAVSLLSKSNKDEAIVEEVMIDKDSGEILIKGLNGEYISYNSLSRLQTHLNKVSQLCIKQGLAGKVYNVELEDHDLPKALPEATNISPTEQVLSNDIKLSKLLFSLDLDAIKNIGDGEKSSIHENNPTITIDLLLGVNNTTSDTYTETISMSKSKLPTYILEPNYPTWNIGDDTDYSAKITSITINRHASDDPLLALRMILHSIIVAIKEVP